MLDHDVIQAMLAMRKLNEQGFMFRFQQFSNFQSWHVDIDLHVTSAIAAFNAGSDRIEDAIIKAVARVEEYKRTHPEWNA